MRPRILFAVMLAAVAVLCVAPASEAKTTSLDHTANHLRHVVVKRLGADAAGRDIIRYGVRTKHGARPAKRSDKKQYIATLRRAIAPPPAPAPAATTAYAPTQVPSSAPASSGGGGCSGMSAESGSSGYNNTSHPGYVGCYQISQDHFSSGGSCAGLGTDPAGQDQCAANICATEGPGAWTNPAGQNPCGRLGR